MPNLDFAALLEASPNNYMVLDRSLRYVWANRAYLSTTGSTLRELEWCLATSLVAQLVPLFDLSAESVPYASRESGVKGRSVLIPSILAFDAGRFVRVHGNGRPRQPVARDR
ncbi:MAG: PAS domain-containing protein [Isosphaeraceae bacterium]